LVSAADDDFGTGGGKILGNRKTNPFAGTGDDSFFRKILNNLKNKYGNLSE
jgi:hypothetical protein